MERAEKGSRRTPQQQTMSKFDRKNQAKQRRLANHQDHIRATNVFAGRDGAPRIVAVIGLCEDVSPELAVRSLNSSLDLEDELPSSGRATIAIDRFKQRVTYVQVGRDLVAALDACRVADYVLLVLSADQEVDDVGETLIRAIESQGVSNVYTAVQVRTLVPKLPRPHANLIILGTREHRTRQAKAASCSVSQILHHPLLSITGKGFFPGIATRNAESCSITLHDYSQGHSMARRA